MHIKINLYNYGVINLFVFSELDFCFIYIVPRNHMSSAV